MDCPAYSQQKAVESAQQILKNGKEYVADIDLSKFFDRVNHDRLICLLSGHVTDKRILRLIGMTIVKGTIAISAQSMKRARHKVKELTQGVSRKVAVKTSFSNKGRWAFSDPIPKASSGGLPASQRTDCLGFF